MLLRELLDLLKPGGGYLFLIESNAPETWDKEQIEDHGL